MSEQEFQGIRPKSDAGGSIYFYCLDDWIELCECIRMVITESFPSYPSMDAENAEALADMLERRLEFGLIQAYFELATKRRIREPEDGEDLAGMEERIKAYVESMLEWTRQYIVFLRECGGCEPGAIQSDALPK